jgi:hypothetical protein
MQQNQPHISWQQHQQQQAQFFIYKQLMDTLLRQSHNLGNAPAPTPAADRLLLLQALIHKQKLAQVQGSSGMGASPAFGFSMPISAASAASAAAATFEPPFTSDAAAHSTGDAGSGAFASSAGSQANLQQGDYAARQSAPTQAAAVDPSRAAAHAARLQSAMFRESLQMDVEHQEAFDDITRRQDRNAATTTPKKQNSQVQLLHRITRFHIQSLSGTLCDTQTFIPDIAADPNQFRPDGPLAQATLQMRCKVSRSDVEAACAARRLPNL